MKTKYAAAIFLLLTMALPLAPTSAKNSVTVEMGAMCESYTTQAVFVYVHYQGHTVTITCLAKSDASYTNTRYVTSSNAAPYTASIVVGGKALKSAGTFGPGSCFEAAIEARNQGSNASIGEWILVVSGCPVY